MKNKSEAIRFNIIVVIMLVLLSILIVRLYRLQILKGDENANVLEVKSMKTLVLNSTRGNIYDRYGELLAHNQLAYKVTLTDCGDYKNNRERQLTLNSIAYRIYTTLMKNKDTFNNELKIELNDDDKYVFTIQDKQLLRFKADIFGKAYIDSLTKEETEAGPDEMIDFMVSDKKFAIYQEDEEKYSSEELMNYQLKESYSKEELLAILGIRYMLLFNSSQKYMPIVIAENVSQETVAYISENRDTLIGAGIEQGAIRVYDGGVAFAHILGYTGKISSEELTQKQKEKKEYNAQSVIGKSGIEKCMEDELRGKNGLEVVYVNDSGKKLTDGERTEPVAGNDIYLSIDKDLQIAVYKLLEQHIAGILTGNIINEKDFDKSNIEDASDIKIPIYDVYCALIDNEIVDLEHLKSLEANNFEQSINRLLVNARKKVIADINREFHGNPPSYMKDTKELQEIEDYIVNKTDVLDEKLINKSDSTYKAWFVDKEIGIKEFFSYAARAGWISLEKLTKDTSFMTIDEIYQLAVDRILSQLEDNNLFDKYVLKHMLKAGEISDTDFCRLLCEQGIVSSDSNDYEELVSNQISAYDFMIKKITNLEITPAQLALDPYSGSAVVVEAKTGKLLACVTYPGYDNNKLANQMDVKYYNQLYNDLSMPFYNRATQQRTAPGSTFKPVTIIAGLQENVIASDTPIFCDGTFDKVSPALRCWKHSGHGEIVNAASAIQNSCNDYLCDVSYRLGMKGRFNYEDKQALSYLQKYAKLFDLDKKTGLEIMEEEPLVTDHYAIPSAIGQGTHNYTTAQLSRYVNTLATQGDSFELSLIKGVKAFNANTLKEIESKKQSFVELPQNTWDTISAGMEQFAHNNAILKDMKYPVAGKSGTAQEKTNRPDHALFIGYAPANAPEISLAVRIANGYASGNSVATGKDIINYYFKLEPKDTIITGKASESYEIRTD